MKKCRICKTTSNVVEVEIKMNHQGSKTTKIALCENCLNDDKKVVRERLHQKEQVIADIILALTNIDETNKNLVNDILQKKDVNLAIYNDQFELVLPNKN